MRVDSRNQLQRQTRKRTNNSASRSHEGKPPIGRLSGCGRRLSVDHPFRLYHCFKIEQREACVILPQDELKAIPFSAFATYGVGAALPADDLEVPAAFPAPKRSVGVEYVRILCWPACPFHAVLLWGQVLYKSNACAKNVSSANFL